MKSAAPLLSLSLLLSLALIEPVQAHEFSSQLKAHKFLEVEKAASAKLASSPNHEGALLAKIEAVMAQGNAERIGEVLKLAEQCVNSHPQSSSCHEALGNAISWKVLSGNILSMAGSASKIRDAFAKAVELNPKNWSARLALFTYYQQAPSFVGGGKDKAQALVQDTTKINKDCANLLQARLDVKDGKLDKAESLTVAVNPAGDDEMEELQAGVWAAIGIELREQKKYAESERVLREMTKRLPNNLGGHAFLGRTLAASGKHAEAITEYETALAIEDRPSLHYRVAQSHLAMGDKPKALTWFEKALANKGQLDKKQREDAEQQVKALKA
jgi:tetratricopeptide (TPR) repeat protein